MSKPTKAQNILTEDQRNEINTLIKESNDGPARVVGEWIQKSRISLRPAQIMRELNFTSAQMLAMRLQRMKMRLLTMDYTTEEWDSIIEEFQDIIVIINSKKQGTLESSLPTKG
jgi:hypothetical protein